MLVFALIIIIMISDFLSKNAIDLEKSLFFSMEMNCFNWNEMFLIWIIFV